MLTLAERPRGEIHQDGLIGGWIQKQGARIGSGYAGDTSQTIERIHLSHGERGRRLRTCKSSEAAEVPLVEWVVESRKLVCESGG